jgi:hypothetical protein
MNASESSQDEESVTDAQFFAELTNKEIEQIRQGFLSAIADMDATSLKPVADELAAQLGKLSARMRLIEEAAELHLLQDNTPSPLQHSRIYNSDPEYISRHFSLMMYLENIFRNRPGIRKFFGGIHRFFSRLLKLP